MTPDLLYHEKQYLGRNSYGLSRRMVMLFFCLFAHYYSEEKSGTTGLFFLVGALTVIVSVVLLFIPLYTIRIDQGRMHLKSLLRREIDIPLKDIRTVAVVRYSRYHFNNPVFNVLEDGEIKFYAEGSGAVLLTMKGGKVYRIGAKHASEIHAVIEKTTSQRQEEK